jgi:hypothetical protein
VQKVKAYVYLISAGSLCVIQLSSRADKFSLDSVNDWLVEKTKILFITGTELLYLNQESTYDVRKVSNKGFT